MTSDDLTQLDQLSRLDLEKEIRANLIELVRLCAKRGIRIVLFAAQPLALRQWCRAGGPYRPRARVSGARPLSQTAARYRHDGGRISSEPAPYCAGERLYRRFFVSGVLTARLEGRCRAA
jgi:hypothetical protein